jgi:hypothetical protein
MGRFVKKLLFPGGHLSWEQLNKVKHALSYMGWGLMSYLGMFAHRGDQHILNNFTGVL